LQNARIGGYYAFVAAKSVVHLGNTRISWGQPQPMTPRNYKSRGNVCWLKAARIIPKGGPRRDT
jgi:hypothetical protein